MNGRTLNPEPGFLYSATGYKWISTEKKFIFPVAGKFEWTVVFGEWIVFAEDQSRKGYKKLKSG